MILQVSADQKLHDYCQSNLSITDIQDTLVKYGDSGVLYKYKQGTGRIKALPFLLRINIQHVVFSMPVHWRK